MTASPDGTSWEAALAALAQAQARTEERLATLTERVDALTARVDNLAAAQLRTEAQVAGLAEQMTALASHMQTLTDRVGGVETRLETLTDRVGGVETRLETLTDRVGGVETRTQTLTDQVGDLRGLTWELRYRDRAPAYLGRILRRIQILTPDRLAAILDDAVAAGQLSEAEADEVGRADLVCRGRRTDDNEPVYLVVEVSAGVGPRDAERAARRAGLLARTGTPALAAVAGQRLTPEAYEDAGRLGVWQVSDGTATAPDAPP